MKKQEHTVYRAIGEYVIADIRERQLAPGQLLPSVRELATRFRVSVRTAHRAVDWLHEKGVCYRIPQKGIFLAQPPEESPRGSAVAVGVYSQFGFGDDFERCIPLRLFNAIRNYCAVHGKQIVQFQHLDEALLGHYSQKLGLLDAVILLTLDDFSPVPAWARRFANVRFVVANYAYSGFDDTPENVLGVFNDDFGGARRMTEYLLWRGMTAIAFVLYDIGDQNYRNRTAGFLDAVREAGCEEQCRVLWLHSEYQSKQWRDFDDFLADCGKPVEVVFCACDTMLAMFRSLPPGPSGRRPLLAGYDNFYPRYTTADGMPMVEPDFAGIGEKSAEVAFTGGNVTKVTRIEPKLLLPDALGTT